MRTNVMREWRVTAGTYYAGLPDGSVSHPMVITNYRMLVFTVLYPWLDYDVDNNMYLPTSYEDEEHNLGIDNVLDVYRRGD